MSYLDKDIKERMLDNMDFIVSVTDFSYEEILYKAVLNYRIHLTNKLTREENILRERIISELLYRGDCDA